MTLIENLGRHSYDFSHLTVNPGVNAAWEYRENELPEGALYENTKSLRMQ
jgi:hypothetical protein